MKSGCCLYVYVCGNNFQIWDWDDNAPIFFSLFEIHLNSFYEVFCIKSEWILTDEYQNALHHSLAFFGATLHILDIFIANYVVSIL